MGIHTELKIDRDRCQHCGRVLYQHHGGKRTREVLKELDGDVVIAMVIDVTCSVCRGVTPIAYAGEGMPRRLVQGTLPGMEHFVSNTARIPCTIS